MAEQVAIEENAAEPANAPAKRGWGRRLGKWAGLLVLGVVAAISIALLVLNSSVGKRFVTDQIAELVLESGLEIEIGRIEGNLYGAAALHDIVLSDPKGEFLTIPEVELDWRPLGWRNNVLDIRELTARRGTLMRLPELNPGDPDAPFLPGFDIRIDRLELDNFTLAPGIAGEDARRVDLLAEANIREGRALVKANGELGRKDAFALNLDAEPERDKFDLALDYAAPQDGVIAAMAGLDAAYDARIRGRGSWSNWRGALVINREQQRFGAFRLTNRGGRYGIVGQGFPAPALDGVARDALGDTVSLAAFATLEERVLRGDYALRADGVDLDAEGTVNLADNRFDGFEVEAQLKNSELFGPDLKLEGARLAALLNGPLDGFTADHTLTLDRLVSGETVLTGLAQVGRARVAGGNISIPLQATVARIVTGSEWVDPRLIGGTLAGELAVSGTELRSDGLRVGFPGASAQLSLDGDFASGRYALAGPVAFNGLTLENVGTVNAGARIDFAIGPDRPWTLAAQTRGEVGNVTNATIANLAGSPIRFDGGVQVGAQVPVAFNDFSLAASQLTATLSGRVEEGRTTLAGRGSHVDYGPFSVDATLADDGPRAELVFADPLPAAGLKDVRMALAPTADGFAIETEGDSMLGPFDGDLGLVAPADGPTRIALNRLDVFQTSVSGDLVLGDGAVAGDLALAGGGLDGTISLSPRGGGQGFAVDLNANRARFAGETPIALTQADIDVSGLIVDGNSTVEGTVLGEGLTYGNLFVGRFAANAELTNGAGVVTASIAGRRGSRFALQARADVAPERIAAIARGDYAGRTIAMPRRAVLTKASDGGWNLAPTQLSYGQGLAVASGAFGGSSGPELDLQLDDMPLALADALFGEYGLGGTISGSIAFQTTDSGLPVGEAEVQIANLTRSGLVLTSRPADIALVADLSASELQARATVSEGGSQRGRVQARIADLPASGGLTERIRAGQLFAQLRYGGPADALWRLAAIDAFDMTGKVSIAADATGTLANPQVRGSLASDDLRIRSALSGTDVQGVNARGRFAGSRLRLTSFDGTTPNGGRVSGSGFIDLAGMGERAASGAIRGPQIDLKIAARDAKLLDGNGIEATVTGPLRIASNGNGGTIAGRVAVDRASWQLGTAADDVQLPQIRTREINVPGDRAPAIVASAPWRYLIDARAPSRVDVDGMGLDSEWSANIRLRGTTSDPRIGGEARMVRGSYSFAGTRFELERGRIAFDENVPIDPRLDIRAETDKTGLDVAVLVRGTAFQPEISFTSTPALPEEEILARLLFGGSITELSATDAVQLGSAVASLRGGGGMDPINRLRTAIGLDRLRIVAADPALNRGTGVALGKNLGRRFYVEIVTDGRGYSATEVEFRVTSWLALLASVSSIGRENAVVEISRDY